MAIQAISSAFSGTGRLVYNGLAETGNFIKTYPKTVIVSTAALSAVGAYAAGVFPVPTVEKAVEATIVEPRTYSQIIGEMVPQKLKDIAAADDVGTLIYNAVEPMGTLVYDNAKPLFAISASFVTTVVAVAALRHTFFIPFMG